MAKPINVLIHKPIQSNNKSNQDAFLGIYWNVFSATGWALRRQKLQNFIIKLST